MDTIRVVDSHTEGEPTRVVIDGWPLPTGDTMAARRDAMRAEHDRLRAAVVCEPRGHEAMVGALLTPPVEEGSAAGVVFFNNVGYLGMCGHGLIGVVRTLEHLGRLDPGVVRIDTPAGTVSAELGDDGRVTFENVPAVCHRRGVAVSLPDGDTVIGDVAYGGNWFFIAGAPLTEPLLLARIPDLLRHLTFIKRALARDGITGADGAEIDHVELYAPSDQPGVLVCRNVVLCPGGEYDRSPCGTGTSAKLAVLHASGQLAIGDRFIQESITGGRFTGWLSDRDGALIPHIQGRAFITAESTLHFHPDDPHRGGFGRHVR